MSVAAALAEPEEIPFDVMTEMRSERELGDKISELEMANWMLADFAALVSHDIRSALRRVLSYAELLAVVPSLNANPQAQDCLNAILFGARRIQFLADGALASPPQAASHRLNPRNEPFAPFNEKKLTDDAADILERRLNDLKSVNRELTDFADSVARGLRAPLGQILTAATRLNAVHFISSNPVSRDLTENVLVASKQMQRLVDDYLSFVNVERHAIYRSRISLESLVQLVRHELEPMAAGRKVTWRIGPLPKVDADTSMLRQVFVNLLSNSLKYTSRCPEAIIEIGTRTHDDSEQIIYIRDNGVGFDLESARNLFQKFARLQNNGAIPGIGIGLVIVRHIIQHHGGRVWAEGSPGGGATFCFSLPVASPEH